MHINLYFSLLKKKSIEKPELIVVGRKQEKSSLGTKQGSQKRNFIYFSRMGSVLI